MNDDSSRRHLAASFTRRGPCPARGRLLFVEMRRDLSRRLVKVLVGLAVLACVIMSPIVLANVEGLPKDDLRFVDPDHPALLVNMWPGNGEDGLLLIAAGFLLAGALVAGASMTGAEWRSRTMATLLTWEPRRARVLAAKLGAAAILAALIAVLLQLVFSAAFLPTVFVKGTTEGADLEWLGGYVGALLRIAALVAFAAVLGASIASIARNTGGALAVSFLYFQVIENLVRVLRPGLQEWLITDNVVVVLTGGPLEEAGFTRSTQAAALVLLGYLAAAALGALELFRRRDVAA